MLAAGRTPGKRACGLRVVMEGGEAVGLRASAVRNLVRLLEGPPTFYVPAIVSILVTRRNQRLGDLAAGTLVIREPRARAAAAAGPPATPAPPTASAGLRTDGVGRLGDHAAGAGRAALVPRPARRRSRRPPAAGSRASSPTRLGAKVAGPPPGLAAETLLEGIAAAKSARS